MSEEVKLPKGWCWTTISVLAESMKNGIYKAREFYDASGTPCLRMYNIDDGQLLLQDLKFLRLTADEIEEYGLTAGDVLVNRVNSRELVGKACVIPEKTSPLVFESKNIRLRLNPLIVNPKYINFRLFHCGRTYFSGNAQQTVGMASISQEQLGNVPVPLAPRKEQDRIIEKTEELLSDLDAGVSALRRAQANLKKYRAAVLRAAVTGELTAEWRAAHPNVEPATKLLDRILAERRRKWEAEQQAKFDAAGKTPPKNWQSKYTEPGQPDTSRLAELPVGWCWARLDQLISYLRNGYFQSPAPLDSGVRLLRINAVRPMRVDLSEFRYLSQSEELNEYLIENGDLLFTRYNGSVDLLGVAGMVRGCCEQVVHPDKLIRVKAVLPTPLPNYLEVACNTGASRRHMVSRARTTAGQTGISGADIKDMPIPLPPLAEQTIILTEVEERLSVIAATENYIEASLKRASRLRQSILKEAFAGRLVPQDPADEPASVLLDRIRTSSVSLNGNAKPRTRKRPS